MCKYTKYNACSLTHTHIHTQHRYESETGLLHVYVENVHLDHDSNSSSSSSSKYEEDDDDDQEEGSSNKRSGSSSKSSSSSGGGIFKSLTRGFKKLMGAK